MNYLEYGPLGFAVFGGLLLLASLLETDLPLLGKVNWSTRHKRRLAGSIGAVLLAGGLVVAVVARATDSRVRSVVATTYWVGGLPDEYLSGALPMPDEYRTYGFIDLGTAAVGDVVNPSELALHSDFQRQLETFVSCGRPAQCVPSGIYLVLSNESADRIDDLKLIYRESASSNSIASFPPEEASLSAIAESIGVLRPGEGRLVYLATVLAPPESNVHLPLPGIGSMRLVSELEIQATDGSHTRESVRLPADAFSLILFSDGRRYNIGG